MQSLFLLLPAFLILLFLSPVVVQVRGTFNIQSRSGVVCLFVFGIKVFYYLYQIEGKNIVLKNQKQTKSKSLSLEGQDLLFVKILLSQIKDKTRLKLLQVFYNLGCQDAFLSALVAGFINAALLTTFTVVKSKKPTASLGIYDTISYNKTLFEIALKGKISISLVDVAYSLLNSAMLTWRTKTKEKHNI